MNCETKLLMRFSFICGGICVNCRIVRIFQKISIFLLTSENK
ncbi:hypothetical protein SSUST1_1844 [Streptococcus suis ST1]|nr:hypothetical protein SSUST1_1844 [Streptococcus suis ST1]